MSCRTSGQSSRTSVAGWGSTADADGERAELYRRSSQQHLIDEGVLFSSGLTIIASGTFHIGLELRQSAAKLFTNEAEVR
jgi:hypothetical protein